jgi:Protein of unknown function (DUF993)
MATTRWFDRIALDAAQVVADLLANVDPWLTPAIDWDATIAFRHATALRRMARHAAIFRDVLRYCAMLPRFGSVCRSIADCSRQTCLRSVVSWPSSIRHNERLPNVGRCR